MGGKSKKILEIVEVASKSRMTIPKSVREILKLKNHDYVMFTRERDGVLLRKIDRFALDVEDDKIIIDGENPEFKRSMNPQHTEILNILRKHSLTSEEIAIKLECSDDSVRGRISELRNIFGFNIEMDDITKRYTWKDWK
jgi:AbrB family looped-hinge helix DNA binding protein